MQQRIRFFPILATLALITATTLFATGHTTTVELPEPLNTGHTSLSTATYIAAVSFTNTEADGSRHHTYYWSDSGTPATAIAEASEELRAALDDGVHTNIDFWLLNDVTFASSVYMTSSGPEYSRNCVITSSNRGESVTYTISANASFIGTYLFEFRTVGAMHFRGIMLSYVLCEGRV